MERLRAELATALREVALFEELIHLHSEHSEHIVGEMQANSEHSLGVRIAAGRDGQTASRKAQIAVGLTDAEVAKLLKVSRSTVCKWHLGTLRIPERAQAFLEKRGIPRTHWLKR